jgi:ribose transport system permease protein
MALIELRPDKVEPATQKEDGRHAALPKRPLGVYRWLSTLGPPLTLIVLVCVFTLLAPRFGAISNIQAILESAVVPAIVAIGLTFVLVQGSIDLSVEGISSLSNMLVAILVSNNVTGFHLGPFAVVIAILSGLACGLLSGVLYTIGRMPSLIVTLGVWLIALGFAALLFPSRQPQIQDAGFLNLTLSKHFGLSGSVYLTVVLAAAAYLVERHTRFGRMLYAIGSDETVLRQAGLPTARYKIAGFMISSGMAAVAGIVIASQISVGDPAAGAGLLFPGIASCVIGGTLLSGGRGGVLCSVIGAIILVTLRDGLVQVGANPLLETTIEGAVIIVAVTVSTMHMRRKTRIVK